MRNEPEPATIYVVDDDPDFLRVLGLWLESEGHQVVTFDHPADLQKQLDKRLPDLLISDLRMPEIDGMELLEWVQEREPDLPVLLLTAHGSIPNAVAAMRGNAFAYLAKPFRYEELQEQMQAALEQWQGKQESRRLRAAIRQQANQSLLYRSRAMQELMDDVTRVAGTQASVFLSGESGAGKERVARAIHSASPRQTGPFLAINCGAIPADVAESELFGHVKGSFTGATADHPGLIRSAHGGTLFLDEVADLPLPLQVKLLRVLQEGRVRPVGGREEFPVDIRVISATHQDIHALLSAGRFREDLYYRLHVIPLRVPSLAERPEDILLLAQHFLDREASRLQREIQGFASEAVDKLLQRAWPGNVRELENVVTQAVALSNENWIPASAISDSGRGTSTPAFAQLQEAKAEFERDYLQRLLRSTDGNISRAARIAGRHRTDLYKLMRKHQLRTEDFKDDGETES
ncbi:sigma-54-dependent Fis family transcriptional regulator [Acidithiobacillus sp. CV18-2]|uniref:Sigma-54-dependent Fis family transcriptional regulator n=1 Tax=Igneacidithiobacillus copahuensis TaxID=2724909 RepID=A0AAE2YMR6_9PROT|nr:sigma-54 dependent transcriptional regulator [Igneacidithiobacillus copahuensis]MBU2753714.1 sigma-54-dependent Fis family transcriptional regulator [Acidithiobacillus sp. CV18-3]MBU2758294.1 sigma-54-dependent Fis family transcriptional regulator [Acidithiobacillus sp. BN09-2]MBU2778053.1 sigma-54-dependent Fis family transcriptional regulator [Acidithiobacillus sp. CV18-2]MBU2796057.1 sigma-54-dependent Fis family transcriptional regulator [Acidithiobacillus sp. VAN18-2]MBU2798020.1 sigma